MLPFAELPDKLRAAAPVLGSERFPVAAATGRTLRAPATAAWDLPRFDNSAMDGYAVRAADTTAARPDQPVELDVVGDIFAGDAAAGRITPGACRYITTGAAIPDGADAVIPIENVELVAQRIR
ncbi:MAG: molybdopterin molybdenumtransferase MoeA, partial [Planctomycetota bacterium]